MQGVHGGDDVLSGQCDMLHAGAAVVEEVFVDLRAALALGGLVDGEFDAAGAVLHHLGHQRGVIGRDRLVGEVLELGEAHHVAVEADPLVHAA